MALKRSRKGEKIYMEGYEAHRIAIGDHSSIRRINTLELMKAPREQRANGRNVNRDRPVSDPNHIRVYTVNSQGSVTSPWDHTLRRRCWWQQSIRKIVNRIFYSILYICRHGPTSIHLYFFHGRRWSVIFTHTFMNLLSQSYTYRGSIQ